MIRLYSLYNTLKIAIAQLLEKRIIAFRDRSGFIDATHSCGTVFVVDYHLISGSPDLVRRQEREESRATGGLSRTWSLWRLYG